VLSVIVLIVIGLSVIVLSVIVLSVIVLSVIVLSVIVLRVIVINIIVLSVIVLSVIVLVVIVAESQLLECLHAKCGYIEYLIPSFTLCSVVLHCSSQFFIDISSVTMLSVDPLNVMVPLDEQKCVFL